MMKTNAEGIEVSYRVIDLRDLHVLPRTDDTDKTTYVLLGGVKYEASARFWSSFCSRFQLSTTVFKYVPHKTMFDFITAKIGPKKAKIRLAAATTKTGSHLLALTKPDSPLIDFAQVQKFLAGQNCERLIYHNGIVKAFFSRTLGSGTDLSIGADEHVRKFVMCVPIDGYGGVNNYLAFVRGICQNGMVIMNPSLQQPVKTGKDPWPGLLRGIQTFDGEADYKTVAKRLLSSQTSEASVREVLQLRALLRRNEAAAEVQACERLEEVAGHLNVKYGLANLNVLSEKRQRLLTANCRVYDLINFASEVATHWANPQQAEQLHHYIGSLLVDDEFDREGTATSKPLPTFPALFLPPSSGGAKPKQQRARA